jgi:hypothetical protein
MQTKNTKPYTRGELALSILSGWTAAPYAPQHRAIEVEAAELADLVERDAAAHVTFSRRVAE